MSEVEILKSISSGGAMALVFWIVYRELPAFRKAFSDALAAFQQELKAMRDERATERAEDTRARHAQAEATHAIALSVQHLADTIGVDLPRKLPLPPPEMQLGSLTSQPRSN